MLLRASGEHSGNAHDYESVVSGAAAPSTVRDAGLLLPFTDAVINGNAATLWATRERLAGALGSAALVDTAATIAIFNAVVRIADATGIPIEAYKVESTAALRAELGIDAFREHAGR